MADGQPLFCPLCSQRHADMKRLKYHVLLSHPSTHVCLWCVEKKGWSDEFPTQMSYNEHYKARHSGIIERRAAERSERQVEERRRRLRRREEERRARRELGALVRRRRRPNCCTRCPDLPCLPTGFDLDRHLVSRHNYDVCKVCSRIGPAIKVRAHIAAEHPGRLCHLCGGSSPAFGSAAKVGQHMVHCHGGGGYFCDHDGCNETFEKAGEYAAHVEERHAAGADDDADLRPLRRKRQVAGHGGGGGSGGSGAAGLPGGLRPVTGLRNDTGQDCFFLSLLHFLGQTDLAERLLQAQEHQQDCEAPACLLANFYSGYHAAGAGRPGNRFPHQLVENYPKFGLESLPLQVGDSLRLVFDSLLRPPAVDGHTTATPPAGLAAGFRPALQWKFLCDGCQRFSTVDLRDVVIKVDGSREGSFEELLNEFLTMKRCSCGQLVETVPDVIVAPDYLFVEVDRRIGGGGGDSSDELLLYPLKLHTEYGLLGRVYTLFATVNYNLEFAEGGHYTTILFADDGSIVRLHEAESSSNVGPSYDTETVLVGLRKVCDAVAAADDGVREAAGQQDALLLPEEESQLLPPTKPGAADHCYAEAASVSAAAGQTVYSSDAGPTVNRAGEQFTRQPVSAARRASRKVAGGPGCCGDAVGLLNNDPDTVAKYRDVYLKKLEQEAAAAAANRGGGGTEVDVSLRAMGDQVLESKIYRIRSLTKRKRPPKRGAGVGQDAINCAEPKTDTETFDISSLVCSSFGTLE